MFLHPDWPYSLNRYGVGWPVVDFPHGSMARSYLTLKYNRKMRTRSYTAGTDPRVYTSDESIQEHSFTLRANRFLGNVTASEMSHELGTVINYPPFVNLGGAQSGRLVGRTSSIEGDAASVTIKATLHEDELRTAFATAYEVKTEVQFLLEDELTSGVFIADALALLDAHSFTDLQWPDEVDERTDIWEFPYISSGMTWQYNSTGQIVPLVTTRNYGPIHYEENRVVPGTEDLADPIVARYRFMPAPDLATNLTPWLAGQIVYPDFGDGDYPEVTEFYGKPNVKMSMTMFKTQVRASPAGSIAVDEYEDLFFEAPQTEPIRELVVSVSPTTKMIGGRVADTVREPAVPNIYPTDYLSDQTHKGPQEIAKLLFEFP